MDEDFKNQLLDTFLIEFEELMDIYKGGIMKLRSLRGDKLQALQDIFRVYHTLKGDAAYFEEFAEFVKFSSTFCERLRNPSLELLKDIDLMSDISLNYSRLSSAFMALNNGKSLQAFRFKLFLRNF
ncbi:MAG: Hpt domain-containing protein [Candidatus Heimdallarchaeota archaeon]|nr:Hpt domain-containing protein [Candidatus Heimdallarchaeota archaeon]